MSKRSKGILFTILSALLFGVTPVLASITYRMGSNANTLTFYRNLLAVPFLAVFMLIRHIPFRVTKKELCFLVLIGAGFRATTTLMLYSSYDLVGIGTATTLHYLYPLFTSLFCLIFFRDRLSPGKIAALVLATAGVALTGGRTESAAVSGVILAISSAVTFACYLTGMDKSCLRDMDVYKVSFYVALLNAAVMALFDLPFGRIVYLLPPAAFSLTAVIAACTSFLAIVLLQIGIQILGAGSAAVFSMFEPITCVIAGWLLLHEEMTALKALSCLLILGGVSILIFSDRKKE